QRADRRRAAPALVDPHRPGCAGGRRPPGGPALAHGARPDRRSARRARSARTARAPALLPDRVCGRARLAVHPACRPAAAVGGEGVKVYLLRAWGVSGSDGLASVMISKTALTTAQSFFVILGLA